MRNLIRLIRLIRSSAGRPGRGGWPGQRLRGRGWLAGSIVIGPVVMRMVFGGGSALTGRVGRPSTAGLTVVAAASLALAQLDEGVGRSHPQLGREGGVVGGP